MKYVIQVNHPDDYEGITDAMDFEDARELFLILTGDWDGGTIGEGDSVTINLFDTIDVELRQATAAELVWEDENGIKILDGIIEEFSNERIQVAFDRTAKQFGGLAPDEADDESDLAEAFNEELTRQLISMAIQDLIDLAIAEGEIEVNGVLENGEINYVSTSDRELEDII